jgi:NADH-quinone oxidoreductase subunit L
MTGEEEDTDVGFPGPEHHIAERAPEMAVAMGTLAVLATVGGLIQIPGVDHTVTRFLEPTFAGSKLAAGEPSTGSAWLGLVVGAALAITGIAIAYRIWVAAPGTATAIRERVRALHGFLMNRWYFDELIDLVFVRPALWVGRLAESVFERLVVTGVITNGTVGVVRAGSALVRRAQSGLLRGYAALLIAGLTVVALYLLITSSTG